MTDGFIKIHRKFIEWEWYTDENTKTVFLHCLLKANWKNGRYMGHDIPRGSFVSSYSQMAQQTDLSVQNVRTAINRLKSTGSLTVCSHARFSVFTVVNYSMYQDDNTQTNKLLTGSQQAPNRLLTTIEERKNIRREEKEEVKKKEKENVRTHDEKHQYGEYKHVLLSDRDMELLHDSYEEDIVTGAITILDEYIELKGKQYKNHYLALKKWAISEAQKKAAGSREPQGIFDAWMNA